MTEHRLDGLESDNLLAFLTLLGLLRALEAADRERDEKDRFLPRAKWDVERPPLRPTLVIARSATHDEIAEAAARGIDILSAAHDFGDHNKLDFTGEQSRELLIHEARNATVDAHDRVDILAALMSDGAIKDDGSGAVQPTPFCLLFGGGQQFFLDRIASVPREPTHHRGKGGTKKTLTASESVTEALFLPWHRDDPLTSSFRWDPEEAVRYAYKAGDPTDEDYKSGTQRGANRLAAVGLPALTVVPTSGRLPLAVIGGESNGGFSFAWPIWREPASLAAIRVLLAHPRLRATNGLKYLRVDHVFVTKRTSVGKLMNFTRAQVRTESRDE